MVRVVRHLVFPRLIIKNDLHKKQVLKYGLIYHDFWSVFNALYQFMR